MITAVDYDALLRRARCAARAGAQLDPSHTAARALDTPVGRVICNVRRRVLGVELRYVTEWQLNGRRRGLNAIRAQIRDAEAMRTGAKLRVHSVNTEWNANGATLYVRTDAGILRERFNYDLTMLDAATRLRNLADKLDETAKAHATLAALNNVKG